MTSLWSALLFALPGVAVAVVVLVWRGNTIPRKISTLALLIIYTSAALLLSLGGRQKTVDIWMEGLEFPLPHEVDSPLDLRIGGSLAQDDIYVPGYRDDAFRLRVETQSPNGAAANAKSVLQQHISLRRTDPSTTKAPNSAYSRDVVTINGDIVGLISLRDGARILAPGNDGKQREITFSQPRLGAGAVASLRSDRGVSWVKRRRVEIPFTRLSLALPLFTTGRFQPLADFASEKLTEFDAKADADPLGLRPLRSGLLVGVANRGDKAARPFNRVSFLQMDPDVTVANLGFPVQPYPWSDSVPVPSQASLVFSQITEGPRYRLDKRLNFSRIAITHPRHGFPVLELQFASPRRRQILVDNFPATLVLQSSLLVREHEAYIRFPDLAERAATVGARVELSENGFTLETPWKRHSQIPYGKTFSLGENHRLRVHISKDQGPWKLWAALAATTLLILVAGGHRLGDRTYFCLLAGSAALTSNRLVCAYTASVRPPFQSDAAAMAIYALALIPAVILACISMVEWLEREELVRSQQLSRGASSLSVSLRQAIPIFIVIGAAAVIGVAPIFALSLGRGLAGLIPFFVLACFSAWLAWWPHAAKRLWNRIRIKILQRQGYKALWIASGSFYLVRVIAAVCGAKEQISIGIRVPLAFVYVTGFIVFYALGCAQYWRETRVDPPDGDKLRRFVAYAGGLTLLHLFISGLLVSDLGMSIYALPASLLLAVIAIHSLPRAVVTRKTITWIMASVMPLCLALAFLTMPRAFITTAEFLAEYRVLSDKLDDPDALITDRQLLRLLQFVDRKKLVQLGTRASEAIAQHLAIMDDYTSQGLLGAGLLKVPVAPAIKDTALSDNAAAVYLLGQFGVVGILGVLAAYGVISLANRRLPENAIPEDWVWWRFGWSLTALCGATFGIASLYMVAANCQFAPFTGRNMYLFGLNSLGDVWESALLLGLMAVGLTIQPKEFK